MSAPLQQKLFPQLPERVAQEAPELAPGKIGDGGGAHVVRLGRLPAQEVPMSGPQGRKELAALQDEVRAEAQMQNEEEKARLQTEKEGVQEEDDDDEEEGGVQEEDEEEGVWETSAQGEACPEAPLSRKHFVPHVLWKSTGGVLRAFCDAVRPHDLAFHVQPLFDVVLFMY